MILTRDKGSRMWGGGGTGGSGGGGGLDPSALAGYATTGFVEDNYVSKAFFNQLFEYQYNHRVLTKDGETVVSDVTTAMVAAPNEVVDTTSHTETDEETGYTIITTNTITGIKAKAGLWTNQYLSALGQNSSGGGGGGATLFEPLLSINESGLAAPTDAQDGMTVVWDKNTHKWKYGATGGGSGGTVSLTPGCLLDTVDNYTYNDYIGQWSQQNVKGSAFLYDIGNASKIYYSASGSHIPNAIRLLWYDKNLFFIGKTDYGIQSEYSVPAGAVYVSFVLYYTMTEIAYIDEGLPNIYFSFLGNDKIYISKDLKYPYGNPDTYNVNLGDYSDSYIEGVASDADYKKFFTDGRGKSICIPFSLFKYYDYVEIKQPSLSKAGISRIHFLKKEPKTNGETVEYSDFYTTNVQINRGNNTIFYKIPDDARYILIYAYWGNEDRRPERIDLRTSDSLSLDDMSKYDERVDTALRNPNQYEIKILHWNIGNYSNGGAETNINDSNYNAKKNSFKAFINKYKDHNVYINEWNSVFAKLSGGNVYAGPELWDYGYGYNSYVRCNDWDELGCVPTNTQIAHKVGVLTSLAGMHLVGEGYDYYTMPKPYVIYRHYIGGGSLYILHTHLPTRLSKQQHQTVFAEMVNIMSGYTNAIICGDLNLYDQSALATFTNAGYTIGNGSSPEPTHVNGGVYDWFVYKGNFTNVSFKVCKDAVDFGYSDGDTSHMLSDHWPISLTLNYTGDSIVPAVRGAYRFNPSTNLPEWHNGKVWYSATTFLARHNGVGTNGTAGWVGLVNINVNSAWASQPLKFRVTQRGRFGGEITLRFTNVSAAVDTDIQEFSYTGNIVAAKIVKSGANFSLYIQKSEAYDSIGISLVEMGSYMYDRVTITWTNIFSDTDPGGTAAACRYYFSPTAYLEYDATNGAVHVVGAGLYSDNYVSALGANSSGGGGGGGASSLSELLDVTISSPSGGQVLTYSNGQWINAAIPTPSMTGYATENWVENNFASLTWIGQQGYLTSSSLNGYATQSWVENKDYLTSVAFSDLTTHPTTIAGYGITDAKIQNGTITLGSNSITPLTSHQTVSGTFWGQAWSNGGTVKGSLAAGSNGGAIEQFHCIELNNAGSLSGYGGYIDFHYNGSAADYTTRLIESEAGVMLIQAKNSASPYADKVVGLKIGSDVTGESYVQIGNVQLVYDSANNALKVQKSDGTAANFYATGGVSALGVGNGGGSIQNLTMTGTLKFSVNGMNSTIYADNNGYLHIDGNENITMGNDVRMGGYSLYTNGGDVNCGGGKMYASRFYVGTGRYIYLDGTTLKYNDNGTVKTIVLS